MLTDNLLRMDPGTGETLTVSPQYSAVALDLGAVNLDIGSGDPDINVVFTNTVAAAIATAAATVTFEVTSTYLPIATATTQTLTSYLNAGDIGTVAIAPPTGTPVRFALNGGTLPAELVVGTTYFVIKASATTFTVATTLANALAGTTWPVTADATGSPTVTTVPIGYTADLTGAGAAFSTSADTVTLTNHGLSTGTLIQLIWTGTLAITGVTTATNAFAIRVDANTFKIATTFANAMAGTAADITADTNAVTTLYVPPCIVGSSGAVPKEYQTIGSVVVVDVTQSSDVGIGSVIATDPGRPAPARRPVGRYLQTRITGSATATAGKWIVDVDVGGEIGGRKFYPSSFTVL